MEEGNLIKEKGEYIRTRFFTKQGWIDLLLGTFIWGFLIVKYTDKIFAWLFKLLEPVKYLFLRRYLSYLLFGIIATLLGMLITIAIIKAFEFIRNWWRNRK